jgi:hypothetical protein
MESARLRLVEHHGVTWLDRQLADAARVRSARSFMQAARHPPRALLPPCRRAYVYRPMKVGTMTPCDLGQRTLLERVVSTARRASPTMSSA